MNLTKRMIETLSYRGNAAERDVRWDDLVPGFGIRIYPSGRKTFVISYRHQGRKRLMTLGTYGVLTLEQARRQARVRLSDVLQGHDPLAEAEQAANGQTLKDLARVYLDRYAKVHKKTWRDDASMLERYVLPTWGALTITALKRADIAARHRDIGSKHPYAANRFVELMSKMFELAKLWGFVDENYPNPARRIPPYPEAKRDRFVTMQELPRLAAAIDQESSPFVRGALWLYLFTGLRKRELLRARWADIDFATGSWRIPETKSGRVHYLPLSRRVRALLTSLPRELGNPYVIPGARAGQALNNIDKAWRRVRACAGLQDVRLHDLRRTAGSLMAQDSVSLHLIGRILNHRDPSTTAVYAHFQQQHEQSALDRHADRVLDAAYGSADDKVVALRHSS